MSNLNAKLVANPSNFSNEPSTQESGNSYGSPAISFGYLVKAKTELYKLQDLLNQIQELESEMTQQQYQLQTLFGKSLSEGITQSYTQQAQALEDAGTGMIVGGVGSGLMAIGEGTLMYRNSCQMKGLTEEQENLNNYKTTYENTEPSATPLSSRPANVQKTEEEVETENTIKEHTEGKFTKPFKENQAQIKRAAELSSDDEQQKVITKTKEQIEANALEQQKVSASGQRFSNLLQMTGTAINGIAQGSGQVAQAGATAAQASSETERALSQNTLQMINPGDTYKQMDTFQQDAINVLQIIEGLENGNKYQPA